MKNSHLITLIFFLITFSLLGIKKEIFLNNSKREQQKINESARILNECIDSENKDKRSFHKSKKLIEYCLKEYGYKN